MAAGDESAGNGLKSVGIAFSILEIVARNRAPIALKLIAERAEVSPSKAHRYVQSLCTCEFLSQVKKSGNYDLGPAALKIGLSAVNRIDIINRAGDGLQSLSEDLNADVFLSVWSDLGPTVVRYERSQNPSLSMIGPGAAFPILTSATGLVFATYAASALLQNVLQQELEDNHDLQDWRANEVAMRYLHVKEKGYAFTSGTYLPGRECVAAPILSIDDKIGAAVTYITKGTGEVFPDEKKVGILLEYCQRYSLSKDGYPNELQAITSKLG